ncbi:zf-TFIIB domain-containing protein [Niabella yanshanensis]|uniref:Zf-TFIIB domain-containing protein n=2 Tax=Niabella yanshanensis TaxID=577386 RepID=A0ABZ0W211_9BACT|nr:zf-TFIIB domain-containing protein [Niabella yanshanensis]WQD36522.1 zf-TFIIB domain-containing protein [Niabella yanshanensis]
MRCPNCNINLVMADRSGVEIDYCPECRGVWLDRGELDKIIDRSSQSSSGGQSGNYYHDKKYDQNRNSYPQKKKKDSFFGDLFDF